MHQSSSVAGERRVGNLREDAIECATAVSAVLLQTHTHPTHDRKHSQNTPEHPACPS